MLGVNVEYIVGCAIGIECFWKDDEDDFGYVVIELGFFRVVIAY